MHFNIAVNSPFCDLRDMEGQYARQIATIFFSDVRVIPTRPVLSKSDNNLVLRKRKS